MALVLSYGMLATVVAPVAVQEYREKRELKESADVNDRE
jgi:hypothetical protein